MEEYIAQEKAARRRHASFGAAVYASGLSTVNPSAAKDESLALPSADRIYAYAFRTDDVYKHTENCFPRIWPAKRYIISKKMFLI